MSPETALEAPESLGEDGRRLWEAVTVEFDLAEHEVALLRQACETLDTVERLQATVADSPLVVDGAQGPKAHPALPEIRQQRIVFSRLIAQLGVPVGDEDNAQEDGRSAARPQRRAARGAYLVGRQ